MTGDLIHFFRDAGQPLIEVTVVDDGELTGAIVGGVDLGLSIALVELAEGQVEQHYWLAGCAQGRGDQELHAFHTQRCRAWSELRNEALAAFGDIVRTRAN